MPLLECSDINAFYGPVPVLERVGLTIGPGEVVGLIGPNGAGKTTLIDVLSGFGPRLKSGAVYLSGMRIDAWPSWKRARLGVSRTFQQPRLFSRLSAAENVAMAPRLAWEENVLLSTFGSRSDMLAAQEQAQICLSELGLAAEAYETARNLSYGQRKIVALGASLLTGATVLLLDEPTSGLAPRMKEMVADILIRETQKGRSFLVAEHDLSFLSDIASRIVLMDRGRIAFDGPVANLERTEVLRLFIGDLRECKP